MQHPISIILLLTLSLILLPVLGTPTPAPAPNTTTSITDLEKFNSSCDITCQTDTIIFTYSLAQFLIARTTSQPPDLDWSSDGCTSAPDFPKGFNFQDSCYRHDFGYRNYANQARLHLGDNRKRIDKKLKRDCYDECVKRNNPGVVLSFDWLECRRLARIYYVAVRIFGKGKAKAKAKGVVGGADGEVNGTEEV